MAPNSGAPSSTRTGHPRCASASAAVSPPSPPPTMRMGSFIALLSRLRHSDPLDLPFQLNAGVLLHARAHRLAQRLDVGGAGAAEIDQEVAVHFGNLRIADLESAAAGGVDQLPGFVAGRVFEGRAAGAALDRLRRLPRFRDLVHLQADGGPIARGAPKQRLAENYVV